MNQSSLLPNKQIAFIKASWHAPIVDRCEQGFLAALHGLGWQDPAVEVFVVPGAFDIPLLAKRLAESHRFAAIVAAGFVVDGGIYRHDFVASTVIEALMQVQLQTRVPVISAVLTPHHFHEQSPQDAFFQDHFRIKGQEAANACACLIDLFASLEERESGTPKGNDVAQL